MIWLKSLFIEYVSGVAGLDQVLTVLLTTAMFVGGFVGCVLDNTVPGKHPMLLFLLTQYLYLT